MLLTCFNIPTKHTHYKWFLDDFILHDYLFSLSFFVIQISRPEKINHKREWYWTFLIHQELFFEKHQIAMRAQLNAPLIIVFWYNRPNLYIYSLQDLNSIFLIILSYFQHIYFKLHLSRFLCCLYNIIHIYITLS